MTEQPAKIYVRKQGRLFDSMQTNFRRRRFLHIQNLIEKSLQHRDHVTILDVGGRAIYWKMLPDHLRKRVKITILNYEEELSAYTDGSTDSLSIEQVVGNACNMPQYGDRTFDIVHSNSVLEHVGSYRNMQDFAKEIRRVGKCYYIQTPNFWFPIDPHIAFPFVHWLPDPIRLFLFTHIKLGLARKADFTHAVWRMDDTRMVSRRFMTALFPDARHLREPFLMIFTKSLIAIHDS